MSNAIPADRRKYLICMVFIACTHVYLASLPLCSCFLADVGSLLLYPDLKLWTNLSEVVKKICFPTVQAIKESFLKNHTAACTFYFKKVQAGSKLSPAHDKLKIALQLKWDLKLQLKLDPLVYV